MKKTKFIYRLIGIAALAGAVFAGPPETAWASGEQVYFGSELYEWELGQTWLIGTYATADDDLESVEYTVTYDPDMLEYSDGGELLEPGKVSVSSTEIDGNEFVRRMNFTPLMAGSTTIQIEEVSVSSGGASASATAVSVPVNIPIPTGCKPEAIQINGTAIASFDADTANYVIDLETYTEHADITVLPESLQTEIVGGDLTPGENTIQIITTDSDGQKACYVLTVNCPEQEEETETVPVVQPEVEQSEEEAGTVQGMLGKLQMLWSKGREMAASMMESHRALTMLMGALIVAFVVLLIIRSRFRYRRRQAVLARRQRLQQKRESESWKNRFSTGNADQDENVIEVRDVTMDFKKEKDESSSIKELVIRTLKRQRSFESFRALDHVSFSIKAGEVVGIIGTNGSGKSTILKIISGVLSPSSGSVKTDKNKIQLLTWGTGFDKELTGRENVYLNGAVIGYTKQYIDEHYDDIVEFAELQGFMEEKVKNYSSGMVSRLGFAIATARNTPEILILDEVLTVGDMFFRKKSEARIQEMIHGGSTVLIVSHSTAVIRKNCTKVVWIEKGVLKAIGNPKEVCDAYERMYG